MGRNIGASRRGFGWDAQNRRLNVYVNGIVAEYLDEPCGHTYYVNNITGDDTNDGLSWGKAVAQVEQACVLSEASRVAGGTSTNYYVKNRIVVQGTGTNYTAVTTEPNYCDIIGLGSDIRSGGAGQVQINHTDGPALYNAGGMRGVNCFNIQLLGGGSGSAPFKSATSMMRCVFYNCGFYSASSSDACIYFSGGQYGGITFERCQINTNDAGTLATYGLYVAPTAGGNQSDWLIIDSFFMVGSTAAYYTSGYNQTGTVVKDCVFQGGTYGVYDVSSETDTKGNSMYINNFCFGTTAGISVAQNTTKRVLNCFSDANGTVTRLTSTTD